MEKKINEIVESGSSKITVIEEALLQNIVGGYAVEGEIRDVCCCECTGK
jgi:hypothetical protein